MAYVPRSSGIPRALCNPHPFARSFRDRDFVLAHNGKCKVPVSDDDMTFHPVGKTDSEKLLCALLTRLGNKNIPFVRFSDMEAILREFSYAVTMNLRFSEVEYLYRYRDQEG